MRLFVAVWPDASVREAVAAFERPDLPGGRWTTSDQVSGTTRQPSAASSRPHQRRKRPRLALPRLRCLRREDVEVAIAKYERI